MEDGVMDQQKEMQDRTPWFSVIKDKSQIEIRGIRWRGQYNSMPLWLQDWDIWWDVYKKKLQGYTVWPYKWSWIWNSYWVWVRLPTQQYFLWQYVLESWDLYLAITIPTLWVFIPWEWKRTQINNWVLSGSNYIKAINPSTPIPSWSDNFVQVVPAELYDNDLYAPIAFNVKSNGDWLYLAIVTIDWQNIKYTTSTKIWICVDWVEKRLLQKDWLSMSATTTGTDSLSWPITATTTLSFGDMIRTDQLTETLILLKDQEVSIKVRHDYWSPRDISAEIILLQV